MYVANVNRSGRGPGLLALVLAAAPGCVTPKSITAGQTGCSEQEITISDEESSLARRTWIAHCRGRRYACSSIGGGQYSTPHDTCKEAPEAREAPERR